MNEPESFLKRHGFLVAGVALPVLVVVAFVLARTLPKVWVEDPRYGLLFAVRSNYGDRMMSVNSDLTVVDGNLRVRWIDLKEPAYLASPRLYRLYPDSGAVEQITLPEPPNLDTFEGTSDLFVQGFEGFRIDIDPRAPDGYEFEGSTGGGSGLLNELLVDHNRRARSVIAKHGRVIVIPRADSDPYGYMPVQFLGWLVPLEGAR